MISIAKPMLGTEELDAVKKVFDSGRLAQGPMVEEFEKNLSIYSGRKNCVVVSSGTAALHLSLLAIDVREKNEVITPDFTFIATANCARYVGATPRFVDVKKDSFNIDAQKIRKAINPKTKAVIPVSLYGQPYDVDAVNEVASANSLPVISDNAQAIGSEYKGSKAFKDSMSILSFYSTKNMTTGEGGAILTDSNELAEKCRLLRAIGQKGQYNYLMLGYNFRMTEFQAAIGIEQLKKLDGFTEKRRSNAKVLDELLSKVREVETPFLEENCRHVYHQYTIKAKKRDELKEFLKLKEVGFGVYYPQPLHSLPVMEKVSKKSGSCKVTEKLCTEVLSLPVHPALSENDLHTIADAVKEFYSKN